MNPQIEEYQRRGWRVIPLRTGTKAPLEKFNLDLMFDGTDQEVAAYLPEWFQKPEAGNIGLITGRPSGIAVIDVDDLTLVEEYTRLYGTGLVQRTPSGGTHLFYTIPKDVPFPTRIIQKGVELFGDRHYVMLPPSFASGERNGRKYSGTYEFIKDGNPAKVPVINTGDGILLVSDQGSTFEVKGTGKYTRDQIQEMIEYALVNGRFPEGQHNDAIFYGSLKLLSDGWTLEAVTNLMQRLDKIDPTPQGETRVANEIARAKRIVDEKGKFEISLPEQSVKAANSVVTFTPTDKFEAVPMGTLLQLYDGIEPSWFVDEWCPDQGILMLAAPPQRFKTWLTLDLAVSTVTGTPFLGQFPVNRTGNVLMIQQEDFGVALINRARIVRNAKLAQAELQTIVEPVSGGYQLDLAGYRGHEIYFHTRAELSFDNPQSMKRMYDRILELRPALVVIDPFYSLSIQNDYFASAAQTIRQVIKQIRNVTGTNFLFVHHTRKNGSGVDGDAFSREQAHGSQFLNAAVEGMWSAGREQGKAPTVIKVVRRFKEMPEPEAVEIDFQINFKERDEANKYRTIVTDTTDTRQLEIYKVLGRGETTLATLYEAVEHLFTNKARLNEYLKTVPGVYKSGYGKYALSPDVGGNV